MKDLLARKYRRAVLVGGLVVIALATYWLLRPNPLVAGAREMVLAEQSGDGTGLFNATISDEQACSNLTPAKLHQAWQILLEPYLRKSRFVSEATIKLESNRTQAEGELRYLNGQGDPWALTMIANQSSDGAKAGVLYQMLATASLFDEEGRANPTLTSSLALAGVRRFRRKLEEIGIERIMLAPGACLTWDQLEQKLSG